MTPEQQSALEGLVDRVLTEAEVLAIDAHLPIRNDVAIAEILSASRTRLQSKIVGVGTILEAMGGTGGQFLDSLVAMGAQNREIYWAMVLIQNSNLDLGKAATQAQMSALAVGLPEFAAGLEVLKAMGRVPDPIHYDAVSDALNIAEGRMV